MSKEYVLKKNQLFLSDGLVTNQEGQVIHNFYNPEFDFYERYKDTTLIVNGGVGIDFKKIKNKDKRFNIQKMEVIGKGVGLKF